MAQSDLSGRTLRIGGSSGYWGDSTDAPRQLLEQGNVDYLTFDYLAEVTMSILTRMCKRDETAGYAKDFVAMLTPLLPEISLRGVKVIANAGGVNIAGCVAALEQACAEAGVSLKIGSVAGDDLMPQADKVRAASPVEMESGAALPNTLTSMNAYLGTFPIARALDLGADIVVTGRCVDSAVILGPLIHEFGWQPDDFDRLAQGALAGHLLECGAQATGGNFTDWEQIAPDWPDMGWPLAEIAEDGSFVMTKPDETGGLVNRLTIGEQLVYEIGDPAAYHLPDVTCDFTKVMLTETGPNRVLVKGARGHAPGNNYKISATWADGWKVSASMGMIGHKAALRAEALADALKLRTERIFAEQGLEPYAEFAFNIVGTESQFGAAANPVLRDTREVLLRIVARHNQAKALEFFGREYTGTALAMATGRLGMAGGRPKPVPLLRLFSFLYPKTEVEVTVRVGSQEEIISPHLLDDNIAPPFPIASEQPALFEEGATTVPLRALAVARSGDKGDNANIGVIARKPEYLPYIRAALTAERVQNIFAHFTQQPVERYDLPGFNAINFLLRQALGGGGVSSTRLDTQAKAYAQILLDAEIPVPEGIASDLSQTY